MEDEGDLVGSLDSRPPVDMGTGDPAAHGTMEMAEFHATAAESATL